MCALHTPPFCISTAGDTLPYAAPEALLDYDPGAHQGESAFAVGAGDVWSLACVALEMLTGSPVFAAGAPFA